MRVPLNARSSFPLLQLEERVGHVVFKHRGAALNLIGESPWNFFFDIGYFLKIKF